MWHPHLKRNWVNGKDFEIIDKRKNIYPAFLQVEKRKNFFLKDDQSQNEKMQCNCRFIKEDSSNLNEVKTGTSQENLRASLNPNRKKAIVNFNDNPAVNLLLKNSGNFRLKEIEGRKEKNLIKDKIPLAPKTDMNNINIEEYLKKLNKQSDDQLANINSENEVNNISNFGTFNNRNNNPIINNRLLTNYPNIKHNFINDQQENFNNFFERNQQLSSVNPLLQNNNLQNLINYVHMNSIMMKNIENLLMAEQSKYLPLNLSNFNVFNKQKKLNNPYFDVNSQNPFFDINNQSLDNLMPENRKAFMFSSMNQPQIPFSTNFIQENKNPPNLDLLKLALALNKQTNYDEK